MSDEVVDTTEAPAESAEPTEPTGEEQPPVPDHSLFSSSLSAPLACW